MLTSVEASADVTRLVMGGECRQVNLTAIYSDGNRVDVTEGGSDWTSSASAVDVSSRGIACPKTPGRASISGAYEGKTGTVDFTVDEPAQPPRAVDDSYSVRAGGVLDVPAPGMLANDIIPQGMAVTTRFLPPFPPGTLTNTGGGGFRLEFGGATGVLRFQHVIRSSAGDSNPATISVTIDTPSPTARISGIVYGRSLQGPPLPVEGIVVIPDGNLRVTDANGRYGPVTLRLKPDGEYGDRPGRPRSVPGGDLRVSTSGRYRSRRYQLPFGLQKELAEQPGDGTLLNPAHIVLPHATSTNVLSSDPYFHSHSLMRAMPESAALRKGAHGRRAAALAARHDGGATI